MGTRFFDAYSLLHLAVGVIFRHFSIGLHSSIAIHILFEWIENTSFGIRFINTYFKEIWPGGKPYADNLLNSIGDTFFFTLGWILADRTLKNGYDLKVL